MKRRERTRQLIELGGLIAKAGIIELTDDDRAAIFGLLVEAAAKLRTDDTGTQLTLWQRRGQRAFADTQRLSNRRHRFHHPSPAHCPTSAASP
ncbi:conjugal transfer protein TraD [Novosphingobium capsulatum]|uniref:conjugal transfer protein TraD n=1 Tax=Novosphingobium capsulatum TaxID=13688 RepID=UPI000A0314B9|nr:conjugal transfer protein TraD [Novosphingobium capsulatum]WQD92415.1 conjugal transfer protein TraD [Novosphingobium capsulatum]